MCRSLWVINCHLIDSHRFGLLFFLFWGKKLLLVQTHTMVKALEDCKSYHNAFVQTAGVKQVNNEDKVYSPVFCKLHQNLALIGEYNEGHPQLWAICNNKL